jgi:hypothetical protein
MDEYFPYNNFLDNGAKNGRLLKNPGILHSQSSKYLAVDVLKVIACTLCSEDWYYEGCFLK